MFSSSLSYGQAPVSSRLKNQTGSKPGAASGQPSAEPVRFQGKPDRMHNTAAHAANPALGTICPQRDLYNPFLQGISEVEAEFENNDSWKKLTSPPVLDASPEMPEPKKHKHVTYTKGEKRSILAEIRRLVLLPGIDTDHQALAEMKYNNPERQLPNVTTLKVWRNQGIGR